MILKPLCFARWLPVSMMIVAAFPLLAAGQRSRTGLIDSAEARRYGLNVRWFTHVQVNPAVARVAGMKMHLDSKRSHAYYEIIADGARTVFSEDQLDAYGQPLGRDGARAAAEEQAKLLKERGAQDVKVNERVIPHMILYVLSDAALLQAIDGETGETRWRVTTGNPRQISIGPAVSDDFVAVINGLRLSVYDAISGRRLWTKTIDGVPLVDPVIVDEFVYIPLASGRVISYFLRNPEKERPHLPSFGRIFAPATAMGEQLIWSTEKGFLNIASAFAVNVEYYIETDDVVAHSPVFHPPSTVLYATKHGTLYAMDRSPPRIKWRFPTGDWTYQKPIPIRDRVYFTTDVTGMYAVNLRDGQPLWNTRDIGQFIAATDQHVYALDRAKRMVVLDAENGSRLATFHTEELDLTFTNMLTDRVFIGTRHGVLQCVHEIGNEWPLIHAGGEESEPAAAPAAKPAVGPKPGPAQPTDPFGAPAKPADAQNADPFADPFGAPPKKDDAGKDDGGDPFGDGF